MKLSIIMPHLPGRKSVHRAVESVKKQTYTDYELLIISDGYQWQLKESGKVRIFESKVTRNYGNSQRNIGLDKMTGAYAVFLDDDNELFPDGLQKISEALTRHGLPEMLICSVQYPYNNYKPDLPFYYPEPGKIDGQCIVIKESLRGERWLGAGRDSDYNYIMKIWERARTKIFDNSVLIGKYGGAGFGEQRD